MKPRILVLPVPGALRVTIDGFPVDLPRSREDLFYLAHLAMRAALETGADGEAAACVKSSL